MMTFELTAKSALAGERYPVLPSVDYSADMLQCTMATDPSPDRFDYLTVERIARDMRNQYVANLLSRATNALAARFAERARGTRSRSR